MSNVPRSYCLCIALLTILPLLSALPVGAAPPVNGTWTINAAEVCDGQTWTVVTGNLDIQRGGSLLMTNNCDLTVEGSVFVRAGGSLTVEGSDLHVDTTVGGVQTFYVWGDWTVRQDSLVEGVLNDNVVVEAYLGSVVDLTNSIFQHIGRADWPEGIRLHTSNAIVDGNSFVHDRVAVEVMGSTPQISNNLIQGMSQEGIVSYLGGAALIEGNTIQNSSNDGIRLFDSAGTLRQNTLWDNGNAWGESGILLSRSDPLIDSNTIQFNPSSGAGFPAPGIYLTARSDPTIVDNLITDNPGGLWVFDQSNPTARGNTIDSLDQVALLIDDGGQGSYSDSDVSSLTTAIGVVDGSSATFDDIRLLANTGAPAVSVDDRGVATFNDLDVNNIGIALTSTNLAVTTITNSVLICRGPEPPIYAGDFGEFSLTDSEAWGFGGFGVYVEDYSMARLTRTTVSSQWEALNVRDTSSVQVQDSSLISATQASIEAIFNSQVVAENVTVQSNTSIGVSSSSSYVGLINSTVDAQSGFDFVLAGSWTNRYNDIDVLSSTFTPGDAQFTDQWGRLNVSWFADVHVQWSNGAAAPGADIDITNVSGAPLASRTSNGNGDATWIPLMVSQTTLVGSSVFDPFTANATVANADGTVAFALAADAVGPNRVIVVLADPAKPTVDLVSPSDGFATNDPMVLVSGNASDADSGIDHVELSVDGVTVAAAGTTSWSSQLNLTDGVHTISAEAIDIAGRISNPDGIEILVDTTPPVLTIDSPTEGALLRDGNVTLLGMTEPGAQLVVAGMPAAVAANGSYAVNLTLADGDHLLDLRATDGLNNSAFAWLNLSIDSVSPLGVRILQPDEGALLGVDHVEVVGLTELGTMVRGRHQLQVGDASPLIIEDDVAIGLAGASFSWSMIELDEGTHTVTFTVSDTAGNSVQASRTFAVDLSPPTLEVDQPDEQSTAEGSLVLNGSSDATTVVVNGQSYSIEGDGTFLLQVPLEEGLNIITITTTDDLGRTTTRVLRVIRDSIPPIVMITTPTSGLLTNHSEVRLEGVSEVGALVAYTVGNGTPVALTLDAAGGFGISLTLPEGTSAIIVEAADAVGNHGNDSVSVTVDTIAPPIEILSPRDGSTVTKDSVTVRGTSEPGARVLVNGRTATVAANGSFEVRLSVSQGTTTFEAQAQDAAGNVGRTSSSITKQAGGFTLAGNDTQWWLLVAGLLLGLVLGIALALVARRRKQPPPMEPAARPPMPAAPTEPMAPLPPGPAPAWTPTPSNPLGGPQAPPPADDGWAPPPAAEVPPAGSHASAEHPAAESPESIDDIIGKLK